jgi:hypothetical protein
LILLKPATQFRLETTGHFREHPAVPGATPAAQSV